MESIRNITIVGGDEGNPSRFTTTIEPIKLNHDAEMAITSLCHGPVFNIHSGNNKVYFYSVAAGTKMHKEFIKLHRGTLKTNTPEAAEVFGQLPDPQVAVVPEGSYKSSTRLIWVISTVIKDVLRVSKRRDAMLPSVDKNSKAINITLNNICLIVRGMKDTPWSLLGLNDDIYDEPFSIEEADLNCSISPAFVYANIIENSYINGRLSRNLGLVSIANTSQWALYEPAHPNYVPINVQEFSKILIELRDMRGEYIKLNPSYKTVISLRIRAIKRV
jgi:hypothetical protein